METYQYDSLAPNQVRLMKLLPGSRHEPLKCEFVCMSIEDCMDYEAMSYVWGDIEHLEEVGCHGASVKITDNLAQGLRTARLKHQPILLWSDQLCINQADLTERSIQVGMMGKIFKNAKQVIMWLGPDKNPDPLAPLCVGLMSQIAGVSGQEHPLHEGLVTDKLLNSCGLPGLRAPAWGALRTMFNLPYFERLWVYQEVYLAASKRIIWGETDLDYGHMKTSLDFIKRYKLLWISSELFGPLGPRSASCMLDDSKKALHQHLNNVSSFKVTEERDRIYGVFGLVEDEVEREQRTSSLTVDYAEPIVVTFMKAATYVLFTTARVDFLESCGLWLHPRPDVQALKDFWPSWLPKWNGGGPSLRSKSTYGASRDLPVNRSIATQAFDNIRLRLAGHTVARVAHVDPVLSQFRFDHLEYWDPLRAAWDLCRRHLGQRGDWKELFKTCILAHSLCDLSGFNERPYRESPMIYAFAMFFAISVVHLLQNGTVRHEQLDDVLRLAFIAAAIHKPSQTTRSDGSGDKMDEIVQEWRADRLEHIKQGKTNVNKETWVLLRNELRGVVPDSENLERAAESIATLMSLYETGSSFNAAWTLFPTSYLATLKERRFFITDQDQIGVGPHNLQPGNPVVILHGAEVPYVLQQGVDSHLLLGPCYLEGIMEGQYIQQMIDEGGMEKAEAKPENFDLA